MSIPRYLGPPYLSALSLAVGFAILASATLPAQTARAAMQQDPACRVLTPVSTGGPLPRDPETVVVRWLGHHAVGVELPPGLCDSQRVAENPDAGCALSNAGVLQHGNEGHRDWLVRLN